jgi:hypothetical protein
MRIQEIRTALRAEPFRRFSLHVADGRKIRVAHREFVALNPADRSVHVIEPDGRWHILDVMLLTGLSNANGHTRPKPKRR